ncbi:MAG: amino acid permease [Anaerolineaceae bacterium]|nr:MAG: amino acid permease [Anaerolineaceae bacterium]
MVTSPQTLKRELGVFGATMMGMGSILGTGVFVSIGIAAGIAGPAVILAIALAALVAICNGLNSAQLAANHAVSGGTYEYGYRYLNRWLGFTAGWMFLLAKSASAATAALGFGGYFLNLAGIDSRDYLVPLGLAAVVALTLVVLSGLRRSNVTNIIIVSVTMFALALFVVGGLPALVSQGEQNLTPFFNPDGNPIANLLQATALMFVAYTGYGRIATMGEEVREPRRIIPRAIISAMILTMIVYISVAVTGVGAVGAEILAGTAQTQAAPLEIAAREYNAPLIALVVAVGAITAMLGVLLNLILGLSRVLLAMGRRRDMPAVTARINTANSTPYVAVAVIGLLIFALVLIGDVKTTWSFSAFTVLIYYSITNLSALQLSAEERLYPKWIAWVGLAACLFLAFWVEVQIWLVGLGMIALGLIWHALARRFSSGR